MKRFQKESFYGSSEVKAGPAWATGTCSNHRQRPNGWRQSWSATGQRGGARVYGGGGGEARGRAAEGRERERGPGIR
eukprot:8918941-Pyramimonas_sp.AAC.1